MRFDRRNFEKKMLQTGILQIVEDEENDEELFEQPNNKPGRKGRKFSFNKEKYERLKQDNDFKLEF